MDFVKGVEGIVEHDRRYSSEAYFFVSEVLSFTQETLGKKGHVTGQELLDGMRRYAMREFGYMARVVLESWGVKRTEDVGEIVFKLVNHGLLGKTENDSRNDFSSGYDFRKAFDESFRLDLPEHNDVFVS